MMVCGVVNFKYFISYILYFDGNGCSFQMTGYFDSMYMDNGCVLEWVLVE